MYNPSSGFNLHWDNPELSDAGTDASGEGGFSAGKALPYLQLAMNLAGTKDPAKMIAKGFEDQASGRGEQLVRPKTPSLLTPKRQQGAQVGEFALNFVPVVGGVLSKLASTARQTQAQNDAQQYVKDIYEANPWLTRFGGMNLKSTFVPTKVDMKKELVKSGLSAGAGAAAGAFGGPIGMAAGALVGGLLGGLGKNKAKEKAKKKAAEIAAENKAKIQTAQNAAIANQLQAPGMEQQLRMIYGNTPANQYMLQALNRGV